MNTIKILILPGGRMPSVNWPGEDIGYDVFTRAIVGKEVDPATGMKQTLWDFGNDPHSSLLSEVRGQEYVLRPKHHVRIGFGIVLGMTNKWFAELRPRSSCSEKMLEIQPEEVKIWHNFVPIDPGFRGEPSSMITNLSDHEILIGRHWSPAQFVFFCECCRGNGFIRPTFHMVDKIEDLGHARRNTGWNNSTGKHRHHQTEFPFSRNGH